MGASFSSDESAYDSRASLKNPAHRLSHEFTPDLDLEMYVNTLQAGNIEKAQKLKSYMRIKYADYPELRREIKKLKDRPWGVGNLPSLNQMHGLEFEDSPYLIK